MADHGRGAWNNAGAGGTKAFKSDKPGPYYYLGTGEVVHADNPDEFAVFHAVKAYQRALNRRLGERWTVKVDGVFGDKTSAAVARFQSKHEDEVTVWGGIGQDTSRLLLMPDLLKRVKANTNQLVTGAIVSGLVRHESSWDAGAVGYVDPNDLGLAQINGPAHPDMTAQQRLQPATAFDFVISYMDNALDALGDVVDDAIAAYNLGIGGARDWISQGRPQMYTPRGATKARDMWDYIAKVREG